MAVEDVNHNSNILNSHKLVMSINDGMCEADVVMKRFIDIIKTKDTSRFRSTVGMLGNPTQSFFSFNISCRPSLFRHCGANSRGVKTLPYRGDQLQCRGVNIQ